MSAEAVGWTTIAQRVCGESGGTKDRRDIVLAIYIYQSPAHTHTSAGVYIYANVTRSSLFSCVDAITDGKFASHSSEEGSILYYNLLYIPYYYISERGFSGEGFPGFGRAHAPCHSSGAGKTRTLTHTQTQTHTRAHTHHRRGIQGSFSDRKRVR